jgi:Tol biopolymer transport system component
MPSAVAASRTAALGLALAALASGCHTDATNPFLPAAQTTAIPATAHLIFTSSAWTARSGAPREVFAMRADGSELTRLTSCNAEGQSPCDNVSVAASADRSKVGIVRIGSDTNGDAALAPPDDAALVVIELRRGLVAPIVSVQGRVMDVDWSPTEDLLVFSGRGSVPTDLDLFSIQPSGKEPFTVTPDTTAADRAARIDATGRFVLVERTLASGRTGIWGLVNGLVQLTSGGTGGDALAGTPYTVGSDSTPDFSPDGRSGVFRRLTSTSPAGLGSWDLMTIEFSTNTVRTIVSGPLWRGAPDWGPDGIAFPEIENGQARLVIVAPDGSNRRVPLTLPSGQSLSSVRWLAAARN